MSTQSEKEPSVIICKIEIRSSQPADKRNENNQTFWVTAVMGQLQVIKTKRSPRFRYKNKATYAPRRARRARNNKLWNVQNDMCMTALGSVSDLLGFGVTNYELEFLPNLPKSGWLVLGCIEADFCKEIFD